MSVDKKLQDDPDIAHLVSQMIDIVVNTMAGDPVTKNPYLEDIDQLCSVFQEHVKLKHPYKADVELVQALKSTMEHISLKDGYVWSR